MVSQESGINQPMASEWVCRLVGCKPNCASLILNQALANSLPLHSISFSLSFILSRSFIHSLSCWQIMVNERSINWTCSSHWWHLWTVYVPAMFSTQLMNRQLGENVVTLHPALYTMDSAEKLSQTQHTQWCYIYTSNRNKKLDNKRVTTSGETLHTVGKHGTYDW